MRIRIRLDTQTDKHTHMQIQSQTKLKSNQVESSQRQWDFNSIFAICAVLEVFLENRIGFRIRFVLICMFDRQTEHTTRHVWLKMNPTLVRVYLQIDIICL